MNNQLETTQVSHSVELRPRDGRCRYWAKVVRMGQPLPVPSAVSYADDIPAPYARRGDEEIMPGDVVFEGEANHHRRTDRGWSYTVTVVANEGDLHVISSGFGQIKAQMKAQGMSPELLAGSGEVAAMVRVAHGVRDGLKIADSDT